jgi:hypothetical protein
MDSSAVEDSVRVRVSGKVSETVPVRVQLLDSERCWLNE